MMAQRLIERLARSRAGFAHDPRLFGQFGQRRLPLPGQRMPGRAEDHQFVLHPGFDDQSGCRQLPSIKPRSSSWRAS
jgi:hypothetical protein